MSIRTTPPTVPPGWQRRQDLIARLADINGEIAEVRLVLPSVNDGVLRPRVEELLAVAAELVAVHGAEPGSDVAEALAGLQSATRSLRVPVSDPVLEVTTETLRTLRAAQGRLRSAVDDALDAVWAAHLPPVEIPEQREPTATLPIQAMLQRLDAVNQRLAALEAARNEQPQFVQQAGLVNFYVGKMRVEVDLARLHLTIGGDNFDLGALSRAAESMTELTEEFVQTVRAWTSRLSATVVEVAHGVPGRVRAVTTGVAKLVRIVVGRNERAQRTAAQTRMPNAHEPEMVFVPPGSFVMGVPETESDREGVADSDARPLHKVTFARGFYLAKYAVTRAEFAEFIADSGYSNAGSGWADPGFDQTETDPVVNVTAIDVEVYARWLSNKTGRLYRLPSEAEWEYAARANTTTARFWGDGFAEAMRYAITGEKSTAPVGQLRPNAFGLYDMLGNVWEWTADAWHDNYDGAPLDGSVWSLGGDGRRVLRGGSWNNLAPSLRSGYRGRGIAYARGNEVGFRLARSL